MYRELGILKKGHVVEARRRDLVAKYIGQTAPLTRSVIDKAKNGVLFVDEAYELASDYRDDFGHEALLEIMRAMEDERKTLVVIMAGYPEAMKRLLETNAGLASRFKLEVSFPGYPLDQLMEIFDLKTAGAGLIIGDEARIAARQRIEQEMDSSDKNKFGNGRYVRNLVDAIRSAMATRLYREGKLTPLPKNQAETRTEALHRIFSGQARAQLVTPSVDDIWNAKIMTQDADQRPGIGFGARVGDQQARGLKRPAAAAAVSPQA